MFYIPAGTVPEYASAVFFYEKEDGQKHYAFKATLLSARRAYYRVCRNSKGYKNYGFSVIDKHMRQYGGLL